MCGVSKGIEDKAQNRANKGIKHVPLWTITVDIVTPWWLQKMQQKQRWRRCPDR
jgi:hypothetical protein